MFKTLALKYIARNIESLLDFLNKLDAQLDQYIVAQQTKADGLQDAMNKLANDKAQVLAARDTAVNLRSGVKNVTSSTAS
jgi:methylthioribose-1-phosphate isomerase